MVFLLSVRDVPTRVVKFVLELVHNDEQLPSSYTHADSYVQELLYILSHICNV
jgi:hypothetical protein